MVITPEISWLPINIANAQAAINLSILSFSMGFTLNANVVTPVTIIVSLRLLIRIVVKRERVGIWAHRVFNTTEAKFLTNANGITERKGIFTCLLYKKNVSWKFVYLFLKVFDLTTCLKWLSEGTNVRFYIYCNLVRWRKLVQSRFTENKINFCFQNISWSYILHDKPQKKSISWK